MKIVISLLILMSLLITEAVAQKPAPGPPIGLTATPGDRQYTLRWTHPSGISTGDINAYQIHFYDAGTSNLWEDHEPTVVANNPHYTSTLRNNGTEYTLRMRVYMKSSAGFSERYGAWSPYLKVTPMIPAPTDFRAELDVPTTGDRTVTLHWTAIPQLPFAANNRDVTDYEYSQNGGTWTSTGLVTTKTVTGLKNGRSYTFGIRGVRAAEVKGTAARVAVTPLIDAPGSPESLNVKRVEDTATLTWSPPSDTEEDLITRYEYSKDGGSTWQSTGSTDTTYTVTGLEVGETYTFLVRAVYIDGETSRIISHRSRSSNAVDLSLPKPKRRIIQDCPVGWVRSDRFAGRTRRVLIYEVNLEMDISNPISIYKPVWVAIYVHPDEGLENLDGWKLQVALPYNHHRDYLLTAENSVVVDAEFVEGGFAFIENPEENPFPMVGVGFTGSPAPGFDYRLYDETGKRVDFGISCYKRGDIFPVLKEMEDPRVLRQVLLESFDWGCTLS